MIFAILLISFIVYLLLPNRPPSLSPAPSHHQSRMSNLNLESMKQLLDEQLKSLLRELKVQVKTEVTNQLEPHITRLTQLHDDQILLRKQFSDLTNKLSVNCPSLPPTQPVSVPLRPGYPGLTTPAFLSEPSSIPANIYWSGSLTNVQNKFSLNLLSK